MEQHTVNASVRLIGKLHAYSIPTQDYCQGTKVGRATDQQREDEGVPQRDTASHGTTEVIIDLSFQLLHKYFQDEIEVKVDDRAEINSPDLKSFKQLFLHHINAEGTQKCTGQFHNCDKSHTTVAQIFSR